MQTIGSKLLLMATLLAAAALAFAHNGGDDVVPAEEYAAAAEKQLQGPSETRGVSAVERLGAIELAEEFPAMDGYRFRARELTIEPDGVVAVHEHDSRPGYAYILEGEIIEHRNDHPEPLLRRAGDVAIEKTGVVHWWENRSGAQVRALIVDIVPAERVR